MRHESVKKSKKKNRKKIKPKTYNKKNSYAKTIDLQKVVGFKFKTFGKLYQNFTEKRKKDKAKLEKLKSKNREKYHSNNSSYVVFQVFNVQFNKHNCKYYKYSLSF